ncbi:MAG: hypothetical protein U5P10_05715 [Spirochaetia bacterium]|nr:hypothetical protein [Spirochaetia bacterium]
MNKKALKRAAFTALFCIFSVTAMYGFETYSSSSWQVSRLKQLYTLNGMAFPTGSFPVDIQELYEYARELHRETESRFRSAPKSMNTSSA